MNNIGWLHTMTRSGRVTRYHNTPMLTRQTIADHSWGVGICLLWLTGGSFNKLDKLLKAALYHDAPEIMTGDVPAPVKVDNPLLTDALVIIEEKFIEDMKLHMELTQDEMQLLSLADTMELLLHCNKEIHMGNGYAEDIFNKGSSYFIKKYNAFCKEDQDWKMPIICKLNSFMTNIGIERTV